MKLLLPIIGALIIFGAIFALGGPKEPVQETPIVAETLPIDITPVSHATAVLDWEDTIIYTDPVVSSTTSFAGQPEADIVLVTDIHGDHLSTSTLSTVVASSTVLIVPQAVKDRLTPILAARAVVLKNGEATTTRDITILAIPMYNLPEAADSRHVKGRGNGYVLEHDGFRVYIAGDTSGIPEMRSLTDIDVAFIPMNLPFTMSVDEAADAVLDFKPKRVYPYHYRGQDGLADVAKFKQLVNAGDPNIEVVQLNWYP